MSLEKQIEETRVGKVTAAVLKKVVRESIQDNTVEGRYKGELYAWIFTENWIVF